MVEARLIERQRLGRGRAVVGSANTYIWGRLRVGRDGPLVLAPLGSSVVSRESRVTVVWLCAALGALRRYTLQPLYTCVVRTRTRSHMPCMSMCRAHATYPHAGTRHATCPARLFHSGCGDYLVLYRNWLFSVYLNTRWHALPLVRRTKPKNQIT